MHTHTYTRARTIAIYLKAESKLEKKEQTRQTSDDFLGISKEIALLRQHNFIPNFQFSANSEPLERIRIPAMSENFRICACSYQSLHIFGMEILIEVLA